MAPQIIGIGMACVDHLYRLEDVSELPNGHVIEYSVQGGGPAATAIAAARVLGAECGMIACVGDDERGRFVLDGLEGIGVDASHSALKPGGSTPMVLVLVDGRTAERHFLALTAGPPMLEAAEVDWDYVAGARILHFDNWVKDPVALMQRARALDVTVTVDFNVTPGNEPDWLPMADVLIGSADVRGGALRSDAVLREAIAVSKRGPRIAVLTLGSDGCVGVGPEGPFRVPAFRVDVVDTCGTGDVFHGAFAYALLQEWEARDCATFAAATAAMGATRLGGRAGLPTADQVAAFLLARGWEGPWQP